MDVACLDRINECKKKLGLIVDVIKVYKVWMKKGNDVEFLAEMQRLMDFAASGDASVQVDLPVCIKQDLMEASFFVREPCRQVKVVMNCTCRPHGRMYHW